MNISFQALAERFGLSLDEAMYCTYVNSGSIADTVHWIRMGVDRAGTLFHRKPLSVCVGGGGVCATVIQSYKHSPDAASGVFLIIIFLIPVGEC